MRTTGGWIIVAADGTVADSETFRGRLRHLARVSCPRAPRASRGRAALIDTVGALWTTDGRTPYPQRADGSFIGSRAAS